MSTGRETVSVIIPTRDRWGLLTRTLASVDRQRAVAVDVVVVDDGSADPAPAAVRDRRAVRIVRHARSRGVAAARNAGIRAATGEWLAFLDDDDLWAPDKLRRQLDLAASGGASFACAGAVEFRDGDATVELFEPPEAAALRDAILRRNAVPAGASNVVARRELVTEAGGFDERFTQIADWDLWIRLLHAAPAASSPEPLVAYRRHEANMAATLRRPIIDELRLLWDKHGALAARAGVPADGVRTTRWVAGALSRAGERRAAARTYLAGAREYRNLGNVVRAAGALAGDAPKQRVAAALGVARTGGTRRLPLEAVPWLAAEQQRADERGA